MFYQIVLTKELEIPPRFFASNLEAEINRRLRQDVEGTCSGRHGFILAVTRVVEKGAGMIREGIGSATFNVRYECIVFMPHKGEVIDAVVKSVNKVRLLFTYCYYYSKTHSILCYAICRWDSLPRLVLCKSLCRII